jgi:hypothetical protein
MKKMVIHFINNNNRHTNILITFDYYRHALLHGLSPRSVLKLSVTIWWRYFTLHVSGFFLRVRK